MYNNDFSEAFKAFQKLRDQLIAGLEKCSFIVHPDGLENLGYKIVNSEFYSEENEEHEIYEFEKANYRAVFLQTYVEKEGGLYFQSLYANREGLEEIEKNRN